LGDSRVCRRRSGSADDHCVANASGRLVVVAARDRLLEIELLADVHERCSFLDEPPAVLDRTSRLDEHAAVGNRGGDPEEPQRPQVVAQ